MTCDASALLCRSTQPEMSLLSVMRWHFLACTTCVACMATIYGYLKLEVDPGRLGNLTHAMHEDVGFSIRCTSWVRSKTLPAITWVYELSWWCVNMERIWELGLLCAGRALCIDLTQPTDSRFTPMRYILCRIFTFEPLSKVISNVRDIITGCGM